MADYVAAGATCDAAVQELLAQWTIFDLNGLTDAADAVESVLQVTYGASADGA